MILNFQKVSLGSTYLGSTYEVNTAKHYGVENLCKLLMGHLICLVCN